VKIVLRKMKLWHKIKFLTGIRYYLSFLVVMALFIIYFTISLSLET